MSSATNVTSPLRQLEAAAPVPSNLVSNSNLGTGAQKNSQQTGGCYNTQINADTINYHGELASDTPPPLSVTLTAASGARTSEDPASANLHSALPSRPRLCRPTAAGRARRKAFCMEQESCSSGTWWRGVCDRYNASNKQKTDNLKQVATRHRVLLPYA